MAHQIKKELEFVCDGCGEEFEFDRYHGLSKGGEFKCYRAVSPCCSKLSSSKRKKRLDYIKGVDRRSPTIDERDFGDKKPFADVEKTKESLERRAEKDRESDKPKSSGVKVGSDSDKVVDFPMEKVKDG